MILPRSCAYCHEVKKFHLYSLYISASICFASAFEFCLRTDMVDCQHIANGAHNDGYRWKLWTNDTHEKGIKEMYGFAWTSAQLICKQQVVGSSPTIGSSD